MPEKTPPWTIITVTRNSEKDLSTYWSAVNPEQYRWIVVDNDSNDGSADVARSLGADVIVLENNLGFSHANNVGFRAVQTDLVAFVNPDVTLTKNGLSQLARTLHSDDALLAPQLVNPDGSTQPNGRGLPFLVDKIANRKLKLPGARPDLYTPTLGQGLQEVDWITGAVVCARRSTFAKIGAWNEKFFLYYEDQELSLRAWKRGVRVAVDTSIQWVHGWKRETASFKLTPWLRELSSLTKFSLMYPRLLFPFRRSSVKLGRQT